MWDILAHADVEKISTYMLSIFGSMKAQSQNISCPWTPSTQSLTYELNTISRSFCIEFHVNQETAILLHQCCCPHHRGGYKFPSLPETRRDCGEAASVHSRGEMDKQSLFIIFSDISAFLMTDKQET